MGKTVFFGYDRAALDREYDNRGKVPNYSEYLARYPAESARTRDTLPTRLDLRYGPAPGETLDLFLPAGGGPAAVHVFGHGGYWRALDKQDFSFLPVGTLEGDEYHRQTDSLAAAWRRRGLAAEVLDMAGHDHFSIIAELGDPGTPLSRAILRQMGLAATDRRPAVR